MSHRAIVAERQPNDRFNIYYSQNGAEDIQLLDELRESLNVHGEIDFEALTGEAVPKGLERMLHAQDSGYKIKSGVTGNLVEPRPTAVNVRQEEILLADDLLEIEVLYVVDEGEVNAYWLAWTYPDVIRPWQDHVEMDIYDANKVPTRPVDLFEHFEEAEPLQTISDFQQGWLSDEFVRTMVSEYHRMVYELQSMAVEEIDEDRPDDIPDLQKVLQTPEYHLVFRIDKKETLVPQSHPFVIPIRLGSSPAKSSRQTREAVAQTRFSIGAGLNATKSVSEKNFRQACADAMVEITEQHLDRVATEFVPGALGDAIEEYRKTRDQEAIENIWQS